MIEQQAEAQAADAAGTTAAGPGRARRLLSGWSASLVQMILGLTQQIALIPVFLRFWSGDVLAAWLVIYAASSLVLMADGGLHPRAINRFLKFKATVDDEGRTAQFYAALLPIYAGLAVVLAIVVWGLTRFVSPAAILRFGGVADFDAAFLMVVIGSLLTLPGLLVGALYRARGQYGRSVSIQNCGTFARASGAAHCSGRNGKSPRCGGCIRRVEYPDRALYADDRCAAPLHFPALSACPSFDALDARPIAEVRSLRRCDGGAKSRWSICRSCWSARWCPIAWRLRNGA